MNSLTRSRELRKKPFEFSMVECVVVTVAHHISSGVLEITPVVQTYHERLSKYKRVFIDGS